MENKNLDYIINAIQEKTKYIFHYSEEDEEGGVEIKFYSPPPEYISIYFNPKISKIEILYWKDLNNVSTSTYTSNYDYEGNQTMAYQECLDQFLRIINSLD